MADQPPPQQPTDKEPPPSSAKITTTPGKGDKAPKRKLFTSGTPEDAEKKGPKVTPKRKKTTSQPGSPTLLGTPGRSIPLSERQQLALLMQMTAEESPTAGPSKEALGTKPLSAKSKVNNQNNRGETSLHISAIKGDVQLAESLISQGADVNAQDFAGWTALHEACNHGHPELTRLLLSAGAFVNALGSDDDTPLHDASANGHREVVEILLEHGANPMTYNKAGKTPLDLAADLHIRNLMLRELIKPGTESTLDAELKGPRSPGSIDLKEGGPAIGAGKKTQDTLKATGTAGREAPKPLVATPTAEDPYEFTQDNSDEQKITIHWMSPDKSAPSGTSCKEITRTIPKAREQSTPVSFSSSSTSDSDLLDPQLQQMMTKPLEDIRGDTAKPGPGPVGMVGSPGAAVATVDKKLGGLVPPTLQREQVPPTGGVGQEVDPDRPLFIDEGVKPADRDQKVKDTPVVMLGKKSDVRTAGVVVLEESQGKVASDGNVSHSSVSQQEFSLRVTPEGGLQGVKYTIPRPNSGPEPPVDPTEEENKLRLTITRLSQEDNPICEKGERSRPSSKRGSPVMMMTAATLIPSEVCAPQKVAAKRPSVCDPVVQLDEKKRRESPTSQIRLQVVSMQDQGGSSSDSTDSKRAWRILQPPPETTPPSSVGTVEPEGSEPAVTEKPLPQQEKLEQKQPPVQKEKTKKHRDKSQKSHKKHKHSHAAKEETPTVEAPPEVPTAAPPTAPTPVFEALKELQPGGPAAKKPGEESDSKDPTARAYYIVKQKQSASGEIKKLLLRTSTPGLVTSSNEEKPPGLVGGKVPEPDSTGLVDATATEASLVAAPGVSGVLTKMQGPVEGGNSASARGSPTVTSSDQVVTESVEGKEGKGGSRDSPAEKTEKMKEGGEGVKTEGAVKSEPGVSIDGKPPPKVMRTLRSNSNLQALGEERDIERREVNVCQPMTRSRRNQLEAAASSHPLGAPDQMDSHPRKRKIAKHRQQQQQEELQGPPVPPPPQVPLHQQASSMEQYIRIRREMRKRQVANILPVVPSMPQRYDEYLMNRKTYLLQGDPDAKINRAVPKMSPPEDLNPILKENFDSQENKRHSLRLRHQIEREKLMLAAEQEVVRVYGRGARAMANQAIPFSACSVLNDKEVYNMPDPLSQEDGKGNSRQRYNGRHFHSWLHDVDEKYEKIKEDLLKRHQHEAMALYAIQKLEWELKLQEVKMWDKKKPPNISKHVPMVEIDRDFDLLPKS